MSDLPCCRTAQTCVGFDCPCPCHRSLEWSSAMMHWFGPESWGTPVCFTNPRAKIPVGEQCYQCEELIQEGDEGILFPTEMPPLVFHRSCFLRHLGIL